MTGINASNFIRFLINGSCIKHDFLLKDFIIKFTRYNNSSNDTESNVATKYTIIAVFI